jgi:hypothetical protein
LYAQLSFLTNSSTAQAANMDYLLLSGSWYNALVQRSQPILWPHNAVSKKYHTVTKKGSQEGTIKSIIARQHKETFIMEMKSETMKEIEKKLLELLLVFMDICAGVSARPPAVG